MVTINKLSMKGFKSFASKTELIFSKGFTIIIGPNGSGKSNIMDGLSFVLGRLSAKDMRADRAANLIHNGGKKGSPAKEAEVTIEFDNSSRMFPIQAKEVKLTRIVRKNGTSIYKINDEVRTRQQMIELLNAARLDPQGHNIIGQGDIVSLAEMKPTERREVIEEIAGISTYEEKKNKCLNELQKVDVKLNEAEIILKERETNLRELKKDRDQAIRYKEIQTSIKDDKGTYIHLQIKDKEDKISEIEKRKKEAEDKIEKITKEIKEIKDEIKAHKDSIKEISEEVEIKGEKDQLILRKEIEELKTTIVKLNSRQDVCKSEVEKMKIRKGQLETNLQEVASKIKSLESEKQKNQQEINKINIQEKEFQKKINNFKEKHGVDTSLNQTLEDIDKEIDQKLVEIAKIQEEKQKLTRNKDQLEFKLNAIEERLTSLKGSKEDLENLKELRKQLKETTTKLTKFLAEDSSYSMQIDKTRSEIYKTSEELAKSKARQVGIQERNLGDLAINKILDLKDKDKEIYGTVISLGDVDNRYSLALEIAVGGKAHSIVVGSDLTAQKCIEYLKNNKLGIATFLPLNKIKPRAEVLGIKDILSKNGVHGLANQLIKHDTKFKNIFSYLLGSTIVVEDIITARKIGIGRVRMVTLEGDLVEPSGAMIGGFRQKRQGLGFKEKDLDENIKKIEEGVAKSRDLLKHIEKKKKEIEELIIKSKEEKGNLDAEILKLEKTLDIEGNTDLLENKKQIQEQLKQGEYKIKEVYNSLNLVNKDLEFFKIKKSKLKEKLADPEIAKDLEGLEEQRIKFKEQSLEIQSNTRSLDIQIQTILNPEKERTEKIIKQQNKENEDFLNELENIKGLITTKNQELKEKEKQEKQFYSNFKDLIAKRNKLNEKIQKQETDIAREEEKQKSNEQRLNTIKIDRAKLIAEFEGLQKEFEKFEGCTIKRGLSIEELKLRIKNNERTLNNIGNVNMRALEVYDQIQEEYQKIIEKVEKLKSEKADVLNMMAEIEGKKIQIFMKTYNHFIKNFKEIFNQLTTKGEAHVILENEENPFEGGVDVQVRVAGNKFLDMRSLSGGEKTLAALAFIFAIQEYSPSPFYLLDEVDAALDKINSELLSRLIQKYAEKAQYIVISHNDNIITEAENIYGVSMREGISKVISLRV